MQDWRGLYEGSCISEDKYKNVWYADRCLFEPVSSEEFSDWIEVIEENYCKSKELECLLFYTVQEVTIFTTKLKHAAYLN